MDHTIIDRDNVAERYVAGKLPPDEAARFEIHYLDCAACIDRVETAERLQRGLARVAAEEAARSAAAIGLAAALSRFVRSRRGAAVLSALLVAILVPAVLGVRRIDRLSDDLARARSELSRREPAPAGARPPALEKRLADAEAGRTAAERRAAAAEQTLEAERGRAELLEGRLAAGGTPRADLTLVLLTPTRGDGPAHRLTLPSEPRLIALWVEVAGEGAPAYRATLTDPQGDVAWRGDRLELNPLGALLVAVPSDFLRPGDYGLSIEALPTGRRPVPVAGFRLRVEAGG